jgi:arylsulfatase A-like enzyme
MLMTFITASGTSTTSKPSMTGAFQTFVSLLKDNGIYDNTLLIVTADHGEAFGEHGQWQHGAAPYQELIRVPLLMRFPGQLSAGQVFRENVQHIDLAPTVLDAVGLPLPEDFQGRSLAPLVTGQRKEWPHAVVYAEGGKRGVEVVARLEEGWKFITPVPGEKGNSKGGAWERVRTIRNGLRDYLGASADLYNLEDDPQEINNLSAVYPLRVRTNREQVRKWAYEQQTIAYRHVASEEGEGVEVDPHTLEELRGLGYVQ